MSRTLLVTPLLAMVLAACGVGATGGGGEERQTAGRDGYGGGPDDGEPGANSRDDGQSGRFGVADRP